MISDAAERAPAEFDWSGQDGYLLPTSADVDLLRAVAQADSLPKVAKIQRTSQPVVRRRLIRLERRTAVALVTFSDEHVHLTDAGRILLSAGLRFQLALTDVLRRIVSGPNRQQPVSKPVVRMAATGRDWNEFVDELAVSLPDVLFHVASANPGEVVDLFESHRVDAAYGWRSPHNGDRLARHCVVYDVLDEPLWIALPVGHRCAVEAEVSLADLRSDPWIVGAGENSRRLLDEVCLAAGFAPRIGHVVHSGSVARSLLWQGEGIALVSPLTALPAAGSGFVTRPLRESPRRVRRLVVDPVVISPGLAAVLCEQLLASYRRKAVLRNPEVLSAVTVLAFEDETMAVGTSQPSALVVDPALDRRLEPDDLHVLHVIDTSGSINRAAPTLMITQPALTRKVRRLERRLGVTLLHRGHRGAALTPQAKRILTAAKAAETEFAVTLRKLGGVAALKRRQGWQV